MTSKGIALALCALASTASAASVRALAAWAPPGWDTVAEADGDLDGDGIADAVRVYQQQDPALRLKNDGMGFDPIDTNPRKIVVLLATGEGYRLAGESTRFIPPAGHEEMPCREDPLADVSVARGLLKVKLSHWTSCGGWGTSHRVWTFRHEQGRMRLIGEDESYLMRNSGEREETSINHLTGKRKKTTGGNEFHPEESHPVVAWDRVDAAPRWLEDLVNE